MKIKAASITDIGRERDHNEDSVFTAETPGRKDKMQALLVVADGMGGHAAGEVASRAVVNLFTKLGDTEYDLAGFGYEKVLEEIIEYANTAIHNKAAADESKKGMGTTAVAGIVAQDELFIAWVGDSRAYLVRDGNPFQLTQDHSFVNELIQKGVITPQEAENHPQKNIITRSIGADESVKVDLTKTKLLDGDKVILCSDGLTTHVSGDEIAAAAQRFGAPEALCKALVDLANSRGGYDNISVAAAFVGDKAFISRAVPVAARDDDEPTHPLKVPSRKKRALVSVLLLLIALTSAIAAGMVIKILRQPKPPAAGRMDTLVTGIVNNLLGPHRKNEQKNSPTGAGNNTGKNKTDVKKPQPVPLPSFLTQKSNNSKEHEPELNESEQNHNEKASNLDAEETEEKTTTVKIQVTVAPGDLGDARIYINHSKNENARTSATKGEGEKELNLVCGKKYHFKLTKIDYNPEEFYQQVFCDTELQPIVVRLHPVPKPKEEVKKPKENEKKSANETPSAPTKPVEAGNKTTPSAPAENIETTAPTNTPPPETGFINGLSNIKPRILGPDKPTGNSGGTTPPGDNAPATQNEL